MTAIRIGRKTSIAAAIAAFLAPLGLLPAALALQVDKLDDVPEAQRALYVEKNGKFVLDVDGYEDPTNLKTALQKERQRANDAEKQIKSWKDMGKSPEEIQLLIQQQADAERLKLEGKGQWDALKQQLVDAHKRELDALNLKLGAKDAALTKYLVDANATTAIAAAKGVPELLLPHIRGAVKVIEENGEFTVRIVGKDGNPRVKNGNGDPMTITDLVDEMRQSEVFGRAFEPSGNSGGGSQGSQGQGGGKTIKESDFNALGPKDQAAKVEAGFQIVA